MIDTLLQEKISARLHEATPAIPVGVSNRHVHLSQQDVEALFGKGYALTPFKPLRQPGQFAAEECVTVVGPKGSLTQVRVLGPTRPITQLEVSRADCFALGIKAPVRESGQLENAGDALLVGPKGHVELHSQVICAWRRVLARVRFLCRVVALSVRVRSTCISQVSSNWAQKLSWKKATSKQVLTAV